MKTSVILKEEHTKNEIIDAAQKLFQKYGIDKTTMDDIARDIGKGKSSLYYYYASKEDVFYAVVSKERDEVLSSVKSAIKDAELPSEKLKMFFITHFKELRHKMNLYSVILQGNVKKHMDLFYRIQKESNISDVKLVKEILLCGIKTGEFKNIKEKDCEIISLSIIMMIQGLDSNIVFGKDFSGETVKFSGAVDIFIKGLKYEK
ncbi:MAG: TetR/AcrR family transcriptional regulator [Endomicrobiaceae bacterium]